MMTVNMTQSQPWLFKCSFIAMMLVSILFCYSCGSDDENEPNGNDLEIFLNSNSCGEVEFESNLNDGTFYQWDFGDGGNVVGESTIQHTYRESGDFTVKLIAKYESGDASITIHRDTASLEITIEDSWLSLSQAPPWTSGYLADATVFDGKIVAFGNDNDPNSTLVRKIWSSANGIDWSELSLTNWSERSRFSVANFNGKLWVLGGYREDTQNITNEILSSSDGQNWTLVTSNADWSPRQSPGTFELNGKLWVTGSYPTVTDPNPDDTWSSIDGVTWTEVTTDAYSCRTSELGNGGTCLAKQYEVFDNKVWRFGVEGGIASLHSDDIKNTTNGTTWNTLANPDWLPRQGLSTTVHDSKLWLVGGRTDVGKNGAEAFNKKETWYSNDGETWEETNFATSWSGETNHHILSFNNKLILIGRSEVLESK